MCYMASELLSSLLGIIQIRGVDHAVQCLYHCMQKQICCFSDYYNCVTNLPTNNVVLVKHFCVGGQ